MLINSFQSDILVFCSIYRYALNVGEMSGVVYSDSGIHIILRTG